MPLATISTKRCIDTGRVYQPGFAFYIMLANTSPMFDALLAEVESFRSVPGELWFRGHSDASWSLLPGLLRTETGVMQEKNLLARFRSRSIGMLTTPPGDNDPARWLFLMQHHGLPTRLLDWTESVLVALYFATEGPETCDGCLYLLLPMELNAAQLGESVLYSPVSPAVHALMYASFKGDDKSKHTLALMAYASNDRLARQAGHFTIHGDATDLRCSVGQRWLKTFSIPGTAKRSLRCHLQYFGISRTSLFNDLDSLAKDLREQHGIG